MNEVTCRHNPPVMILGCGRSGTSILGELFTYIEGYDYTSEPPYGEVAKTDFRSGAKAFKVPHASPGFPPDCGLSFPLRDLLSRAPNIELIWIVRNPLDAICSLKVGISQDWGHHPRPPDWQRWMDRPLLDRCAHHWQHINGAGFEHVRDRAIVVRFEAMIADPIGSALKLCGRLRIDASANSASLLGWADRVQNANNELFVEAGTSRAYSRPDHTVRVGRWRENLTPLEIERVKPIVEKTAYDFAYDLEAL